MDSIDLRAALIDMTLLILLMLMLMIFPEDMHLLKVECQHLDL